VRAITSALARSENLLGGGFSSQAASAQLRWAGELLSATASTDVRRALAEAVGNLAGVVAHCAFDIGDYPSAHKCSGFALRCADDAQSWSLRANILAEMARTAAYQGKLDEALSLVEFAQVRADRLTATARAMLGAVRAQMLARVGRYSEARVDVRRADEQFGERAPDQDPPWLTYYDEAEHLGSTGKALMPVAGHAQQIDDVVSRLAGAVRLQDPGFPRSRAFSGLRLASVVLTYGDPREGALAGDRAVNDATGIRSDRLDKALRDLARAAEPRSQIADVALMRQRIVELVGPAR
jgi:tetratricopeptide (TPR) repeat protein